LDAYAELMKGMMTHLMQTISALPEQLTHNPQVLGVIEFGSYHAAFAEKHGSGCEVVMAWFVECKSLRITFQSYVNKHEIRGILLRHECHYGFSPYQGRLPHNVTKGDTREEVERKIGSPETLLPATDVNVGLTVLYHEKTFQIRYIRLMNMI
jgi:hypothetical protein